MKTASFAEEVESGLRSWNARRLDAIARYVTGRTASSSSEKPAVLV